MTESVSCTARLWCFHKNQTRVYVDTRNIFPLMRQNVLQLFRFRRCLPYYFDFSGVLLDSYIKSYLASVMVKFVSFRFKQMYSFHYCQN